MRILVTGGAGFIGSYLCGAPTACGDAAVCADSLSTGHWDNVAEDDLVRGLVAMVDCAEPGPVSLGNPGELTVPGLARLVLRITGPKPEIVYRPLPEDDPARRCPAIKLAGLPGWRPETGLAKGLAPTADWLRSRPAEIGQAREEAAGAATA